jgi:hypothetical protein
MREERREKRAKEGRWKMEDGSKKTGKDVAQFRVSRDCEPA